MKKRLLILLTSFIPLFSSCNRDTGEIKTICPLGAPSIVFYDQGNNDNFVTTGATATILAQFQRSEYDAIVVDSTSGLKASKKYNSPYKFAKLLTKSNLYLVSKKHTTIEINDNTSICAFGSINSIPYLTLKAIYNVKDEKIDKNDGVTSVVAKFKGETDFDYYVLAEPALTTVKSLVKVSEQFKLDDIDSIPQAALFINKNTYNSKKDKFNSYVASLNTRINNSINNIAAVTSTLSQYGDDSKVNQRFGLPKSSILTSVQSHNGLGVNKEVFTFTDMNNFLKAIGSEDSYTQDDFINI